MKFLRFLTLALIAAPALAQSGPSVIVGRVTSNGKPLGGALVRVDSDVLQNIRNTRTTTRGTYWSASLPPGTYRVTFAHAGTQTVTRTAVVRADETVRVDADLPPSEEGESVTMTAITRSIMERPDIETPLEPDVIDQLPIGRELSARLQLAPGVAGTSIRGSAEDLWVVDGVFQRRRGSDVEVESAIADAAVISTTMSGEFGRFSGGVVLAATRSGGNDVDATLRSTMTTASLGAGDGATRVKTEAAVGGRIVRDALWYFVAAQTGADAGYGTERSGFAKLTASPGSMATFNGSVLRASEPDESRASGDATLLASHRALIDAHADTQRLDGIREHHESLTVDTLVPTRFGDHAIVAGGEEFGSARSLFAGETWSDGVRVVLSGNARWDEGHGTSPRAGIAWDPRGDGRGRFSATWGRYAGDIDTAREAVFAYTQRVLGSGFVRVSAVRRAYDSGTRYQGLEAEGRAEYLFLNLGGSVTAANHLRSATLWATATAPAVEQHFTLAFLERYRGAAATDLALSYRYTRPRVEPFAKLDMLNLFDEQRVLNEEPLGRRRALRLAVGLHY